ncbi:hypothetical protein ACNO8S_19970 (plasmid) [Haloarcula sp. KBTZ06]|uniref:Uncharacterized protein n=2 Tax=Haloarcula TaxID=2237 RepID=M0K2H3_9EURY|nr:MULTISPECIES: hypothetical protein [Haloarcula]EMA15411.1 hypothetical protein C442_19661 [Haloarcula amylolytica JCM 13557]
MSSTEEELILLPRDMIVMAVSHSVEKVWGNPFGRLLTLLVGVGLGFGAVSLYPPIFPMIEWAISVWFVLWGVSRFYVYGIADPLTSAGGSLLMLGGFTLALHQLIPMGELAGAIANFIPALGIFVELFAEHYREQD